MTTLDDEKRITESDRRINILEHVKERQDARKNTTKAIVIRYMKEKRLASRETTHYLINDLISEGKLNKKEINSQVHFLTLNEENEFNKIYKTLSDIQNLINQSTPYMYALPGVPTDPDGNPLIDIKEARILSEIQEDLRDNYIQSFILMILIFHNKIEHSIRNEKDQIILFRKLNTLSVRLALNPWLEETTNELLTFYTKNMDRCFKMYTRRINRKTDLGDKIIETIEKFKKEFLSETKQKTKQPHEISG